MIKNKEVINYTIYCWEHFFFLLFLLFRTFFWFFSKGRYQKYVDNIDYLPIKFVFFKKYIVSENTFLFNYSTKSHFQSPWMNSIRKRNRERNKEREGRERWREIVKKKRYGDRKKEREIGWCHTYSLSIRYMIQTMDRQIK